MKNYKLGFVILHYNTINVTIKCVQSIKEKIDTNNYFIVIVDNNSSNKTGLELLKKYEHDEKIKVILNDENIGFSKGNNIGIKYATENQKCDFIAMINSDTELIQNDFFNNILKEYDNDTAIIGPEIQNPDGNFQFPAFPSSCMNIKILKRHIFSLRIQNILNNLNLYVIYEMYIKLKKKLSNDSSNKFLNKRTENIVLHGSCIIFTPKFFESGLKGILEKTKFYCEEQFIYLLAQQKNLKIVYNPDIKILHNINGATNMSYKTKKSKYKFQLKNKIDSNKELVKYIEKEVLINDKCL